MAIMTLILGESGTGKTTSLRNLPPEETFIISVTGKHFPVRGFKQMFPNVEDDGENGRYYGTNKWNKIVKAINSISANRPKIKYLVLDDFQYIMADEFFERSAEAGFNKYNEIGAHAWEVINAMQNARTDLFCIMTAHTELTQANATKIKTIGKLFDEKGTPEGRFSYILHSLILDGNYKFLTRHDGTHNAKTDLDLFDEKYIDNDIYEVIKKIKEFWGDEIITDTNL
jgi:hypothetical protein